MVRSFKNHRNKRFAHLDLVKGEVKSVFCDFRTLQEPLFNIFRALTHINFYMLDIDSDINVADPLSADVVINQFQELIENLALVKKVQNKV